MQTFAAEIYCDLSNIVRRPRPQGASSDLAQGYYLGSSVLSFNITILVNSSAGTTLLTLNPSTPFLVSRDNNVAANLLGDLAAYQAIPEFPAQVLFIPQYNGEPPP